MKAKWIFPSVLLFGLLIGGCARNNANENAGNNNGTQPTKVNYNTRDAVPRVRNVGDNNDVRNLNQDNKAKVADRAAEKITGMKEVDRAVVIVTNNNAFTAVQLADNKHLSNSLEERISKKIKSTDKDIGRVYVSANPDFYEHMTDYGDDLRNGRPVKGFYDEFSQMVRRIFPDLQ
ncbi:YhcN/YlaJ family sporulation lipoprotein [Neobacillus terrae]|uniref:YhcN/YlaJ family sporulation lipoprotein n=1 Tax=Neobacillus terrae TaxID=3034837 RepID=UPI00140AC75B|nr:YhcN/YlaJ family sporulation lipoprotein [Neobacillus terrae]NHM29403.1 YhcN/YlaJ family sporulation lipoprotein [Neobacillus terrae]